MERELRGANIQFVSQRVDCKKQFVEALTDFSPDLIICDHSLPQFSSDSAIKIAKEMNKNIPFLLATGTLTDSRAIEYLKDGAYDYVLKTNLARLPFAVKNALSKGELIQGKQHIEFENIQLQQNNRETVAKNKEITDSIIYAKEIQKALLPKQSTIQQHFPESFLINIPKDIVSGDFYWLAECNGKIIVAIGDCTGHGVPGALISIMGHNKLNYIVKVLGLTTPSDS